MSNVERALEESAAQPPPVDPENAAGVTGEQPDAAPHDGAATPAADGTPDEFGRLRELLLGAEQAEIARLRTDLDEKRADAHEVSELLPEAIRLRADRDDALGDALGPTIGSAVQAQIKRDPQALADAISPIMGPAIRKAIAQAIRGMVQTLNQTLEHSVSVQGLKWRVEAWRTGRPFAEVVLLHTLVYRIEQVFLVHRRTGLLLQHADAEGTAASDPEMISGMMTAIGDFVQDSFGGSRDDALQTMQVGDREVWIEQGPDAVLAAVIRGHAPEELHTELQETLEAIHVEQRDALAEFEGNAAPFAACHPRLDECLQARYQGGATEKGGGSTRKAVVALATVAGLLLLAACLWWYFASRATQRWNGYVAALRAEPGIVVTEAERRDGDYLVRGLRDPLAADPDELLDDAGLDAARVDRRFTPYQSFEPRFALARARQVLQPPEGVTLELKEGVLRARGTAPHDWIARARTVAPALPGVGGYDEAELAESDGHWWQLVARLRDEPGIVVTSADWQEGRYTIRGMRDPLSRAPAALLEEADIDPQQVDFELEPYASSAPSLALARARQRLAPPDGVELTLAGGVLRAGGAAPHAWIESAGRRAATVPGVERLDARELVDTDRVELERLARELEGLSLFAVSGSAELQPGEQPKLAAAASRIGRLLAVARAADQVLQIEVTGHVAGPANNGPTRRLSRQRADTVVEALVRRGIPADRLRAEGRGAAEPARTGRTEEDYAANRRVTFRVEIREGGR